LLKILQAAQLITILQGVTKGKWHPVAVDYLSKNNIVVDFSKRGFTDLNETISLKRFKIKKI
jgi:hypothetical protein